MHKAFGGQARFLRIWPFLVAGTTKIVEGAFHDTEAQPFTERDFRFTTKNDALYACELGWLTSGEAMIHSLAEAQLDGRKIASVSLLGSTSAIAFDVQNDGLHLRLPAAQASGKYAHCFKITFEPAHQ